MTDFCLPSSYFELINFHLLVIGPHIQVDNSRGEVDTCEIFLNYFRYIIYRIVITIYFSLFLFQKSHYSCHQQTA